MYKLRGRRGFSLIELLIVIAIILIIITMAVPKLNKAKMGAQETAAMAAIKAIHSAQVQYYSQYGRYATSLTELGPPASGADSPSSAGLLSTDLASGTKQGYKFTVTGTNGGYTINANPESYGNTGSCTLYSDQTMAVHQHFGPEPATANDKEYGMNYKQ
jgi:type IV pilus assembly protein PilA